MPEEKRRKEKIVNPTNILLTILITVISTFFSYLITENKDLKKEFKDLRECVQEKVNKTSETILSHLEWHRGKADRK